VALSGDGKILVTGNDDGTIRFWVSRDASWRKAAAILRPAKE
jgi:WD40 repeat protein